MSSAKQVSARTQSPPPSPETIDDTDEPNQISYSSPSWNTRGWLNFLRQGKARVQNASSPSSESALSTSQPKAKPLDTTSTDDDDEEEEEEEEATEPETDGGSEEPHRKNKSQPQDVCISNSNTQPPTVAPPEQQQSTLDIFYNGSFGFLDLQSSDLTFPSDDDDEDDNDDEDGCGGGCSGGDDNELDRSFHHRDDIYLLKDIEPEYSWGSRRIMDSVSSSLPKQLEHMVRSRRLNDDEVALLSERDDIHDRHISYNVDTIENTVYTLLEDLTLLELKRRAHEGAEAFNPDQESILFFPSFETCMVPKPPKQQQPPPQAFLPPLSRSKQQQQQPGRPPKWSDELRRRLEIQKAYQLKLSYGGRNTKRSSSSVVREKNPHGELWTVCEECSDAGDSGA